MLFNYFVAYDLVRPGQNYKAVIERIESLGVYATCSSRCSTCNRLCRRLRSTQVRQVMDPNDRLAVILAADAFVSNYDMGNLSILRDVFQRAA